MSVAASDPIIAGNIALSFHRAAAGVTRRVLESHGHRVKSIEAEHEELFDLLSKGEVDVLVSAWLPSSHGRYLSGYREPARVLRPHCQPCCVGAVPPYVPVDEVGEVSDLARSGIAEHMTKATEGINPGAGISRFSATMVGAGWTGPDTPSRPGRRPSPPARTAASPHTNGS